MLYFCYNNQVIKMSADKLNPVSPIWPCGSLLSKHYPLLHTLKAPNTPALLQNYLNYSHMEMYKKEEK